ncbi:N-6 DNA methylase [Hymenobacter lutimineralis]|uniref:site-specific DNA-methyltransferase (adenine-specific) n=1 Tax=Hymenobacter lutimineralis TaxID=2606448 RepID=A0A5D6VBP3_9BACT|nr:N-6 DNA methylase [Hymenobacter lutimineralis]TYZ12717.1 N-6 DNA methylase [Hymenobacter lutimineralis]
MKLPATPAPQLQKQLTKLFSIIRNEARVSSFTAVPALLLLSRLAHESFRLSDNIGYNFYVSSLNDYQDEANYQAIREALTSVEELMSLLSFGTRHDVAYIVDSLELARLTQGEFERLFDFTLDQLSRYSRGSEEFTIPTELAELIASIYEAKPGMRVYNLQAGTAALVPFLNPAVKYIGQEHNSEIRKLAALRLAAYQRSSVDLLSDISPEQWTYLPPADLILATLPVFGKSSNSSQFRPDLPYKMPADAAFVHTVLRHLQPYSRAVIPVTLGFLFQQGHAYRQLRQDLVTTGALEAVIEFPAGILPHSGMRLALLLLNKARPAGQSVLLLDAESYTQRKGRQATLHTTNLLAALAQPTNLIGAHFITEADFSRHDYDFTFRRYLLPTAPAQNQAYFEQVAKPLPQRSEQPTEGRLLRIGDLKTDNLNYTLTSAELSVEQLNGRRLVPLKQDALLVALQGGRLKPTWYTHQFGEEVFLSPTSILPLQLKQPDEVVLDYLIAELNSEFVQQQVRNLNIGSAMPAIRKSDLWQLIINLPGIDEQRNLVRITNEQADKTQQLASDAAQTERTLKAEAYAQLAALKHALGRPQLNLTSNVDLLDAAIQYAAAHNQVLAPQSPLFPSESTTVQETIAAIKRDLEFMFQTINRNEAELNLDDYPLQAIDILAFLREEVAHIRASLPPFTISLSEDFVPIHNILRNNSRPHPFQRIDSVTVQANEYLLKLLFNHVIDNAQRHGFSDMPRERSKIDIRAVEVFLDENLDSFALSITIANNGRPFPLNFDIAQLTRKGAKAGTTGNTGIGGYEVKQIVNYFGGELEIISQPDDEYTVAYQLELPVIDVQYKKVKP